MFSLKYFKFSLNRKIIIAKYLFLDYSNAHRKVIYVSTVYDNSPSSKAGLVSRSDFIVGNKDYEINELDDIGM